MTVSWHSLSPPSAARRPDKVLWDQLTSKAHRYIEALDTARCNAHWHEIPDILRKILKHAPERKCMIQTAQAEYQVASYAAKRTTSNTPPDSANGSPLLDLIPTLLSVIGDDEEGDITQDIFQARVCLSWLHWELLEPALAVSCLPKDLGAAVHLLSGNGQPLSPWTEELLCGAADAIRTMKAIVPRVSFPTSPSPSTPQYLFWTEQLLAKIALLSNEAVIKDGALSRESAIEFALKSFRAWASHRDVKADPASISKDTSTLNIGSKPQVWRAYYNLLSHILQHKLSYISWSDAPKRGQFVSEFRRVETICENSLLRNAKFPRADASNQDIEVWVEQVIHNWHILCSSEWQDADFGEGGHDALSRNVLDILYRAATKTFHSTLILRRLFQVHSVLAEFDLAIKALDTYISLVDSARSRATQASKSVGETESIDDFVRTLSEGINTVCCFGTYRNAEKAKELTDLLERILANETEEEVPPESNRSGLNGVTKLSPTTIAIAHRAVGIGLANWSRWTPITESRRDLQASAIASLEASLSEELGHDMNSASIFALGLVLAETRDINGAIDRVRLALSSADVMGDEGRPLGHQPYTNEYDLVPLWHLLALLLSAREEYESASHVCDAVLDTVVAGNTYANIIKSEYQHQNGEKMSRSLTSTGNDKLPTFDNIGIRKKENILELRMTQLSLIETLHGPETAVNHAEELLALFGRIFAGVGISEPEPKSQNEHLAPPKSSSGTVRTFRGSFLGRKKPNRDTEHGSNLGYDTASAPTAPSLSTSVVDGSPPPILLQAGNPSGSKERPQSGGTRASSVRRRDGTQPHKLHKREGSVAKSVRHRSHERRSKSPTPSNKSHPDLTFTTAEETSESPPHIKSPTINHNGSMSARQSLAPIPHNMKYNREPPPIGHPNQPPQQDIRLPTTGNSELPAKMFARFSKLHTQKQSLCLLIKIWLFVAGLYRRAGLFEDALGSWNEAKLQAKAVEELVGKHESSAKSFADPGWGGTQSSDELWGDVYAERGFLFNAQCQPFEAMKQFEEALIYSPDHVRATVGLANLLLDVWEKKLPTEEPELGNQFSMLSISSPSQTDLPLCDEPNKVNTSSPSTTPFAERDSPEYRERLAARDRAYGLLSAITKLGTAWDDSEAWLSLARAYEHGNQVEKAKEVLWWCIDLEDRRPIRHWWNIGFGGYIL
ncbi:hypothetical protein LOZ12_002421 [Ophidiomyces ophidiicola]|uniref:Uncharacterized protein n=1 Tax=Ophidiomyces ophidiicola TaxID=1387563 RepID=A0ACB8UY83_9EURO|nr:hypothetical protein LOZ64_002654 [Ophidiomyces ophidiicola]KAI1949507.1 hypothetical protein LOZ62_002258 [Ophidiomyces ophidiicola]KAI1972501.1 hypothetical protein LOZ56_002396 [Ophidiomyces ophidiicola]KAI2008017.1 hypothetical protein LOZ50_002251 [Ophidiomyces ophidiicola]KAI2026054.1 hypothetical protein LOZ45_003107 [Ophidiomyces ophidiicola]